MVLIFYSILASIASSALIRLTLAQNICTSPECIKQAKEIVEGIDQDIDPCDDFYEYACGTWKENTTVPRGYDTITMLDLMDTETEKKIFKLLAEEPSDGAFRQTYEFYQSCINESPEDGIVESLRNIINDIGGWPILGDDLQVTSLEELLEFQARMVKRGTRGVLFNIEADERGNGPLLVKSPKTEDLVELNPEEVYSFLTQFNNKFSKKKVEKDVIEMNEFVNNIKEIIGNHEHQSLFIAKAEKVQMLPVVKILYESIRPLKKSEKIYMNKDYFLDLQTLEDFRAIVNYQIFLYVKDVLKQLQFTNSYPILQSEDLEQKPRNCLELTKLCYDDALGLMFIKKYHNLDKYQEILKEMFADILTVFKESVGKNQWLDEKSRAGALRKVNNLHGYFELPSWAQKMDTLNEYYKNFEVDSKDIVKNSASCKEQTFKNMLIATTQKDDKKLPWDEPIFQINAYYYQDLNIFRLFEGFVQSRAFNAEWISAMKYGSLGEVIGHEIAHGFDNDGINYNENGEAKPWMTDNSAANYEEIVQCYINRYNKFIDTDFPSKHVNGTQTAGENIADNEGLKLAYYAYKKWTEDHGEETVPDEFSGYNIDSVFFLSYAHTYCQKRIRPLKEQSKENHAPYKVRINGVTSNMPEFANAFNCPKGTFMNPEEANCALW